MDGPERIWLEPPEEIQEFQGRMWSEDKVWNDGIEYIRADLASMTPSNAKDDAVEAVARLEAEIAAQVTDWRLPMTAKVAVRACDVRAAIKAMRAAQPVEGVKQRLVEQMENADVQSLPSSICRERGLVWLEGWFDLGDAMRAAHLTAQEPDSGA